MMKKYRREPKSGVVVRIPLTDGRFGYLCSISGIFFWLYDFVSDHPIKSDRYFLKSRWKAPCSIVRLYIDAVDVCKIELTEEDEKLIPLWKKAAQWEGEPVPPGPYRYYDPDARMYRFGSEEDIKNMHKDVFLGPDDIGPWITRQASELEPIHVPLEDSDTRVNPPATDAPEDWAEDEPRVIEVIFPWNHPEFAAKLNDLEDQFNMELDLIDGGSVNGTGYVEGGSADIALNVNPRRIKTVLRMIRAVLKRFNAPPETEILENHPEYDEPIKHSLKAPPPARKGKKR